MSALVGTDAPRSVLFDPHATEEPATRAPAIVGSGVLLLVGPHGRRAIAHDRALQLPGLKQVLGGRVRVRAAFRQVHGHDVRAPAVGLEGMPSEAAAHVQTELP